MKRLAIVLLLVAGTAAAQMPATRMPECSLRMIQGTYVIAYQGWVASPPPSEAAPFFGVIMGVLSVDSGGAITGNATMLSPFGKSLYEMTVGSLVEVNADCTGTMTLYSKVQGSSDPPGKEIDRFVYLRQTGEFVVVMDTLEWGYIPMSLGSWKRMSNFPGDAEW